MPEVRQVGGTCLLFDVESLVCALPIEHAVEVMRPQPVHALAGAPAPVLGMAMIRGAPVPVIDAARLLGLAARGQVNRFLTVTVGARRVSLGVKDIRGVRTLSAASYGALPPLLRDAGTESLAAMGALDDELLLVLQTGRLIPEEAWTAIDAARGRS